MTVGYAAIAAGFSALAVVLLIRLEPVAGSGRWYLLGPVVLGTILADVLEVRVRVFGRTSRYGLSTVAFLAAIVTTSSLIAAVGCSLGVVAGCVILRERPVKVWMSGALVLAEMALAGRLIDVLGPPPSGSALVVAMLALFVAVFFVVDGLCIALVALVQGEPPLAVFRSALFIGGLLDLASALLVGLGAGLVGIDPLFLAPMAGVVALGVGGYRSYFRLQGDLDSFLRLHSSTKVTTRGAGTESERSLLLLQALDLIDAQEVQLFLGATSVENAFLARTDRDRQYVEAVGADAETATQSWNTLTASHAAVLQDGSIVVQLSGTDGPMGGLQLLPQFGHPFTETDRRLVEMFANHAPVALQNEHLVDQLRYDLLHDRLTALPNRVMFDLQTRACLGRRRDDELVGVMLLDVDEFKEINDTLGHDAGDELLVELGRRIAEAVSDHDGAIAARLGGDEFAIVVPGCVDDAELAAVAARIRAAVSAPSNCTRSL